MGKRANDNVSCKVQETVAKGRSLVFAPHPDDEVFGCGGAIVRHVEQGDQVKIVIVTDGGYSVSQGQAQSDYVEVRKDESLKAAKILGCGDPEFLDYHDQDLKSDEELISHLLDIVKMFRPQNVYLPASSEVHVDHRELCLAGTEALRRYKPDVRLYYYEIGHMQSANVLLDITKIEGQLDRAMDCFVSQLDVVDYKYCLKALHSYRSYGLGKKVRSVEAYRFVNTNEIKSGSELWKRKYEDSSLSDNDVFVETGYPLISVIVRSTNRPELAEALECLRKQTYPNMEILVVDALGEGDLDLSERCGNHLLRIVTENVKLPRAQAANAGLREVKGEYFCFLDEDDLLFPEHISNLFNVLKNAVSPAAYSNIKRVDSHNELINVYDLDYSFYRLLWRNFIPIHALLFRSGPVKSSCLFDDRFDVLEDRDFLIQVGLLGDFVHLDELSGVYRDTNSSGIQIDSEKISKYQDMLSLKWKELLSKSQYIEFLDYLSSMNLSERTVCKKKLVKEQLECKKAQKQIKGLRKEKRSLGGNNIISKLRKAKGR